MKLHRLFAALLSASIAIGSLSASAADEKTSLTFEGKEGPGKGKHVVLIAGDEEYRSEESLPMLAKILSQRHGFKCSVLFSVEPDGTINPENVKSLSHPEALDTADAVILAVRFRDWPDETMEKFDKAYRRGVPIVALRTSTHAFQIPKGSKWAKYSFDNEGPDWPKGFGRQVLGETWVAHQGEHKKEATRGIIEDGAERDPVLRGATDFFAQTDVYAANPSADAKVLVRGAVLAGMKPTDPKVKGPKNEPMQPIVWTRVAKNEAGNINKVLTTTMGSANDLLNESLRRLVVNGVYWGVGLEVPKRADVNFVDDYKPTFYGFKEYRKGVKVADLERKETPAPAPAPAAGSEEKIAVGETIEIFGSEDPAFAGSYEVRSTGSIAVPKVGRISVAGKTLAAAEAHIKRATGDATLQIRKAKPGEPPAEVPKAAVNPAEPKKETKVEAVAAPAIDLLKPQPRPARPALLPSKLPLSFIQGERIAFVGNSLGEHFNKYGYFETLLHSRFPKSELMVRNFCFPADEVGMRQRSAGYTNLDDPQLAFAADTYFCFFGYNESFAGPAGVAKFKEAYGKFLDETAKNYPRDDTKAAPRFVLVSPIAFEPTGQQFLPDGKKENDNLRLYATAVSEVAQARGLAFVHLFESTLADFSRKLGMQFTTNGAHTNEEGDRDVAELLDRELFGTTNPAKIGTPSFERLRAAVNDKSWVHLQDYRMLNGWYVYGGRNTHDRETFPREYVKIRNMAAVRDRYVWDLAQEKRVAAKPDDAKTGDLFVPKTMFGTQPAKEPKEIKYPTPEESIASMKVPEGYEVQLVASEREFPQLAKVHQINFDNKGRLWAACMPTYPQWLPGQPKPNDRLLIFDNLDAKGKAKKCTVFYDKLVCPTGFEFWNGGVIVVDEPRLLFLKDTDGDDKADLVVELSDGWATDDTHHTIGAFEWSPGGLLHMLEGVSLATAVETPWGPMRESGKPGCYVLDPRSQRIRHFVTPGYGNPWCYVFNWWGQGIVGDGTTPQQHWDTPLSTAPYAGRKGLNTVFDGEGMRPNVGTEFLYTRQFPDEVQGNFVFACVINMNGLTTFTLGDDGAGFKGARKKKTIKDGKGVEKQVPDDLLSAVDNMVFRPTDPQIGPDGALYFGDWSAALIGHMQYSQRDPNRDHAHGRLYRLVYKSRPLLKPVTQSGKPVYELLEQLKEYEPRTRYRARRELRDRPTGEVLAQINKWVAHLNPAEKEFDRLLLEALWVQQGHHAVDPALLQKVLRTTTGDARAGATRVLADEWDRIPNAMELIKPQVADDFARTRAEAIRALSFVRTPAAVETMLLAVDKPRDYWIDYTLQMSIGALEGVWKPALEKGQIAANNPKGLDYLRSAEEQSKPGGAAAAALKRYLTQTGLRQVEKEDLVKEIAKGKGVADNGKAVFRRICIACHKFGDEGIEYGPHIDGVAARLKREDIVESVLDPNAKIDPKFVTTNIETNDGGAFTGFVVEETPEVLTLAVAGGLKQEIKIDNLKKRETVKQSSMPEGLANGMSPTEFLDIVEFLSTLKTPKK